MSEKTRHINIPVFIPHLGCPNACVFCNQRTISGTSDFREEDVRGIIDGALATVPRDSEVEIAFFGGSFTGIDRSLMLRLLDLADEYIDAGKVTALRCSTRPDYIDDEILSILISHRMTTVELGIQSTDDAVLAASRRGHDSATSERACRAVKAAGLELVGQMMTGLPGADVKSEIKTAEARMRRGYIPPWSFAAPSLNGWRRAANTRRLDTTRRLNAPPQFLMFLTVPECR